MASHTSKVSQKGQTTIPSEVRKALGLCEGDLIFYEFVKNQIVQIRKLERIDLEWTRAIESTLSEWKGDEDDDL